MYSTLDVEPGWETAVEQVLGEALSAQVVNGRPLEKVPGVPDMPAGAFVFDDQVDPPADVAGTLAAKARGPARVAHWLQSVKVASDLDEAKAILPVLANGESVVTPDGHWIGAGLASASLGGGCRGGNHRAAGTAGCDVRGIRHYQAGSRCARKAHQ